MVGARDTAVVLRQVRTRVDPAGRSPTFLLAALKDPISGNLDRIQIVKVTLGKKNKPEQRYQMG